MNYSFVLVSVFATLGFSASALAAKPAKKSAATPAPTATPVPTPAAPQVWDFALKQEDSVFAIVTHKTGLAAKLAHNHLIAARQINATISADPTQINSGKFTFTTKVKELEFDRADLQKRWYPTIQALGWLNEPYATLKDSDRETIREHGLADDQLNAEKFSDVQARLESLTDAPSKVGAKSFAKKASVSVTIRGQTVKRDFPANVTLQGQELTVEAVADFKFTEFGIKPYKALMGALGNEDKFNMLVSFRAMKK